MTLGQAHETMLRIRDDFSRGSNEREALAVISNALDARVVYLVKRQMFDAPDEWNHDELIAVCSTMKNALQYVDKPNFDIIITEFTIDGGPDSEKLMENIESYRES